MNNPNQSATRTTLQIGFKMHEFETCLGTDEISVRVVYDFDDVGAKISGVFVVNLWAKNIIDILNSETIEKLVSECNAEIEEWVI
jgi:hypothetical protein